MDRFAAPRSIGSACTMKLEIGRGKILAGGQERLAALARNRVDQQIEQIERPLLTITGPITRVRFRCDLGVAGFERNGRQPAVLQLRQQLLGLNGQLQATSRCNSQELDASRRVQYHRLGVQHIQQGIRA